MLLLFFPKPRFAFLFFLFYETNFLLVIVGICESETTFASASLGLERVLHSIKKPLILNPFHCGGYN